MPSAVPGVKFTIMRTIAMLMNLVAVILSVVFTGIAIDNSGDSMALITMPIIAAIAFSLFIKVEIDKIDDNRPKILLTTVVAAIVIQIIIAFATGVDALGVFGLYLPLMGALFAMIICWHYTLSIYKNEKTRFLLGFVGFEVLFVGFAYSAIGLLTLISAILVAVAVVMDLIAEKILISKKLLTYI